MANFPQFLLYHDVMDDHHSVIILCTRVMDIKLEEHIYSWGASLQMPIDGPSATP